MANNDQQKNHVTELTFKVNLNLISSVEYLNTACANIAAQAKELIYQEIFKLTQLQQQEPSKIQQAETKE